MAKIKLGARPKSFARIVKFTDIDGTEMSAPVTYKYRTRKEYGAWHDTLPEYPQVAAETEKGADGKDKTVYRAETLIEKRSEWNANRILQCVESWGLDEEFNPANVRQLCDEMPACADAIANEYQAACIEGRLGN
jgi:hypothetical protein